MPPRSDHPRHHLGRELSVKPRRTGYVHRDIITVCDGMGMTERGEVIGNLPIFAATNDSCVWVTVDPAGLLRTMLDRFEGIEAFNYQTVSSTEVECEGAFMEGTTRLTRFGFNSKRSARIPGVRNSAMHLVWSPGDMTRNPQGVIEEPTHQGLMRWAKDVRDWCSEQDVPLPTALSGIAASLLKDRRFWPDARGRVPTATNERVRPFLPGVYSELRAQPGRSHTALAIDQRAAYHHAAQEVSTPDPTTLFARGYFHSPEDSPVWATPGDGVYERTMSQPGIVYVTYHARPLRKYENRPPCIKPGSGRAAIWTNEVSYLLTMGVTIEGIVAAWTSADADTGLPKYGEWAAARIGEADDFRRRWLKPTLHATYGLLAMRPRKVSIGHLRGKGVTSQVTIGAGHQFTVKRHDLPVLPSPTTNVAMLGVLQAEIRLRSLRMASNLEREGVTILHIHADGIHVEGDLPLLTNEWSVKPRNNLTYLDRVSWTSDEGDTLPGRDEQQRIALRRHRARLIHHLNS